jgi:hypothetical protein
MLVNWKTTIAGLPAIMIAAGDILHMAVTGEFDPSRLGTDVIGILVGLGLVAAKDGA